MGSVVVIAAFLVATAIDDAWYLAPSQGSGTHDTWLYGNVEGAVGQVFSSQFIGCSSDGLHLGMGRDVVQCLSQIVGTRNNMVLANHYGTNGYLAFFEGLLRLG